MERKKVEEIHFNEALHKELTEIKNKLEVSEF